MKQKLSNFEVMIPIAIGTPQHRNTGNGIGKFLKLCILIWMLIKVDVGWGQLAKPNLIQNPDFTVNSGCSYYWESFYRGCVNSWFSSNGSAHHISWDNNQCFDFNNTGTTKNCLFSLQSTFTNPYIEAIFQPLNIIRNNFITYDVAVQLNLIRCDNQGFPNIPKINARANLRFANGLVNSRETFTPIQGFDFQNIGSEIISSLSPVTISFLNLTPDRMFNNVQIFVDLPIGDNEIGQTFLELVNLNVNCNTSALDNIVYNNETQRFEAINANPAHPFVQYRWQLPDNIVSTQQNPIFDPQQSGKYNICLEVLDVNGCKGSLCKEVQFIEACNDIVAGYLIKPKPLMSRRARLSELLADTECPLEHEILPNGTIMILNKYFYLTTDLIVDVKCEFERTNWFCAAGTLIDVQTDMTIKHSEFQSCDEMWKGFKHQNGRILRINDSSIKDAEFGVELIGAVNINCQKVLFENCYIGLYAPALNRISIISNSIKQSDFECTNVLKPQYPGQVNWSSRTKAGIEFRNSMKLNVDDCTYLNLTNGIFLNNTAASIKGSIFYTSELFFPGMYGVWIDGLRKTNIEFCHFNDQRNGIIENGKNNNSSLDITKSHFRNLIHNISGSGIDISNNQNNRIHIYKNYFYSNNGFPSTTFSFGINANGVHKDLIIDNNEFYHYKSTYFTPIRFLGVKTGALIQNNTVDRSSPMNFATTHILFHFFNSDNLIIKNNQINKVFSANDRTEALRLNNCSNTSLINNNFYGCRDAIGVLGNSMNNLFCCNTSLSKSTWSIFFAETNMSDFRNNNMNSLWLSELANIGTQTLPGNLWQDTEGSNVDSRATMEGPDRRQFNQIPFNPLQINSKPEDFQPSNFNNGWFIERFIYSNCTNNPKCLDEFDPNGTGNGNGGNGENSSGDPQPPIGDPTKKLCDKIMANYYNFTNYAGSNGYPYPNQMTWSMNQYLQHYISVYGQSFFDSCIGDSVVWITPDVIEWYDAEKEKDEIFKMDPSIQSEIKNLSEISDSLYTEISLLIDSVGYTEDSVILQILYDELEQVEYLIQELSDSINNMIRLKALDFMDNIPNLPAPYGFLTKRKKVWEAELKAHVFGKNSVSQQDWDELRSIANTCPIELGKAVSESQGLLSYYWDEQYEMNYSACNIVNPRSNSLKTGTNDVSVYPNPGTGIFNIFVPEEFYYSTLTIYSNDGLAQKEIMLSNNNTLTFDLSDLNPGIYLYQLESKSKDLKSGKIVLIK